MSLCADCVIGVRHEGTPEGTFQDISGVQCYVATPSGTSKEGRVILYLTDIFGPTFVNHQLLADDFARNGYRVVIPDILNGDPVPTDAPLSTGEFDLTSWLSRHGQETVWPVIAKILSHYKYSGIRKVAAVGFCFGARTAIDLAFQNMVSVCVASQPSLWKVPDDLQRYLAEAKAPLLINCAETDNMFPKEAQEKADEILGGGKYTPGYERTYWEGCTHGFAVRGDISDPRVKAGKEGVFKASVEFLNKYWV
ncbi:alpha/beta-hydrolase [Wolfiporia cocos MD-104 SS10]|uniref:Alpha/beta-hydrolase n=1 Tax=Wolfiporia cocos (strain MD-104) TaxID=742152 RepID=A0A2H3JQL2_WOLCO|nr:alpha/beta-hydrolase [Wolfiporia cocos MD-104 SS10]